MEKKLFKIFFSKEKELKWLNELGQKGYLLSSINDSKYTFNVYDGKEYYYSLEYLEYSPRSTSATDYYNSRMDDGVIPLLSSGNWVYFAKEGGEIASDAEIYKKNSRFYLWRIIYLSFFAFCGAVLCGYHAFAIGYLKKIGHVGNGQIREMLEITDKGSFLEGLLNALKSFANFFLSLINKYIAIWTKAFGESDAMAVISFAVPITLIVLIVLAFNIDEFIRCRSKANMNNTAKVDNCICQEGEANNAEQAI